MGTIQITIKCLYRLTLHSGLPMWLSGIESPADAGDVGSIPGSGSSPGEGNGNPLQYSYRDNPMDRGAWQTTVHRVTKSQTRLSAHRAMQPSSRLKKEKVNHLKFRKLVSKSNKIMFRRKSRIKTSESAALKVQEQWREWKQNVKSGAMGQGTCRLYWTEGQSPLWAQLLFLIADYKTFFDLSLLRHYIDIVQISLFLPQAVPFWHSLRNNQPVHRQFLPNTGPCFHDPSHTPFWVWPWGL